MEWLDKLTEDGTGAIQLIIITLGLVVLLIVLFWIFRKIVGNSALKTTKNRVPRLSVTDSMPVDETRHLVLVRRDNLEHLVLIGGPTDVVIETGIVRIPKPNQNSIKNGASPMDALKAEETENSSDSSSVLGKVGGLTAAGVAGVGGVLAATKDKVSEAGSAVVEKTGDVASAAVETTTDAAKAAGEKTADIASSAVENTKDLASSAVETTKDAAQAVGDKTSDVASAAVEKVGEAAEATADAVTDSPDAVVVEDTQMAEIEPEIDLEASLTEHLDQELSIDTPEGVEEASSQGEETNKASSSKEELQKLLDELATS